MCSGERSTGKIMSVTIVFSIIKAEWFLGTQSTLELSGLSALLEVPLVAGTVNNRRRTISAGLIVNNRTAFCGSATTTTELSVIESVFKLRKAQPSMIVSYV
ncbi:Eukaryotic translation initiation factor 6-2 [Platanthera guangdongensis]|uniref:Eukaryotic translation initiation factor 6-2 n=1 Tax=Platanthera guangdongensis TaxID=2320717 RepID=A0ABR2MIJ4_9ASPA